MKSQGQVEGDPSSGDRGIYAGSAGKAGYPASAPGIVPGVVVLPVVELVDIHPSPLHAVQGSFRKSRIAGGHPAALDLAHPAAEADGIGTDDPAGGALVRQENISCVAFIEGESPEIDPGGTSHPLVHVKYALPAHMVDGIDGVGRAVGERAVGNIDGIFSAYRNVGAPGDGSLPFAGRGLADAGGSGLEGVLIDVVHRFRVGKTGSGGLPGTGFLVKPGAAHPSGPFLLEGRIVVTDDFPALDVPFARGDHHGAGVLQHGNQVGEDIPLRVHVFHGPVRGGPLPFPPVGLGFVVAAVALPEGDVPAGKSPAPFLVGPDEGDGPPLRVSGSQVRFHRTAVLADLRHRQPVQVHFLGEDVAQGIGPVSRRGQAAELFPEPLHVGLAPGKVGQLLAEVEIQRRSPLPDFGKLEGDFDPGAPLHAGPEGIGRHPEFAGGLGMEGRTGGKECSQEDGECFSGHLRSFRKLMSRTMRELMPRARRSALKSLTSPLR